MTPIDMIMRERQRQHDEEGWTDEHDDHHDDGSLAAAAAAYAYHASLPGVTQAEVRDGRAAGYISIVSLIWPRSWSREWWNPKSRERDLVRAGALIVAELERLQRKRSKP